MGDYYATRRGVLPSESVVPTKRLQELERKERAHDAYMRATTKMRARQDEIQQHLAAVRQEGKSDDSIAGAARLVGWLAAMREFAEEVVRAPD